MKKIVLLSIEHYEWRCPKCGNYNCTIGKLINDYANCDYCKEVYEYEVHNFKSLREV